MEYNTQYGKKNKKQKQKQDEWTHQDEINRNNYEIPEYWNF